MQDYDIPKFRGLVNAIDADKVKEGTVVDGLNWLITPDKIELRRGMKLLGTDAGVGQITGLRAGRKIDGVDLLFRTRARKIEYYDDTTEDWIENGSNSLPAAASTDEICLEPYTSLAGYAMYLTSPNSSIYKIMLANPGSLIDMSSTSFRGRMRIKNSRILLWHRKGSTGAVDKTGLNGGKLDKDLYSDYTAVTAEAIGALGSLIYTGILAFKAAEPKRSCFNVTFTDGVETFNDNFDGTLTGSAGGTGTINYATGVYSVTFAAVAAGPVTSTYYWEDPTNGGICDFSAPSNPRAAGESFILRQDDGGGDLQNIAEYNGDYYCFHEKKTWKLTISADDTDATNLSFRTKVGIPNWRAMAETGDGIYYLDTSDDNDPKVRLLTLAAYSTEVIPRSISDGLDLSDYEFDKAVMKEWGDYILLACRKAASTQNDRLFVYDRRYGYWSTPTDYQASAIEIYNGALELGDSTTNNVYECFSGWDDDDSEINNYIVLNETVLGYDGLKKPRRFIIEGDIQPTQTLKVYLFTDKGSFVEIGTITGNGSYVDMGSNVYIGATTIGKKEIGGGGTGETANHFQREWRITADKGETFQVKFQATGIGYVSVSRYGLKDLREKGRKTAAKYIVN